jgi:hypothetical protein
VGILIFLPLTERKKREVLIFLVILLVILLVIQKCKEMPFTVKVICNKTLKMRRLYVDRAVTYDGLVNAILTGFGCADANAKLCIWYIDCENDFVGICNTDDLKYGD